MAESVVRFLINQLSTLLSQEITLLGELKSDVQFIKDELSSMKAFLREAEAKEDNDSQLQEWLKQVREVAYDTEDVLDDFICRFARGYMDGFCGKFGKIYNSIKNLKARHQISLETKDIKARVGKISARHQRYQSLYGTRERGFSSSRQVNADFDIHAQSLFIEEAPLVGIDKPKAELISKILEDHSQLRVVSVVGMGGLEKTTLVKKVYDDAAVKKQFQNHAWITVSQNFQFSDIIKNLIQQLYNEIRQPVPPQVESMDVLMLSEFVKDFLQEKRYILVLDDVWSIDAWEAIKCVLLDCNITSRVVLTTRIADVASASCLGSLDSVYKMEPLSDEESWTLFCNRTFQSNDCPSNLEEVAKKVLKKCEGLPHAIVAIGGVLALKDKENTDEWKMILHGFGGESDGSGKLDRMKRDDGRLVTCGFHDFLCEITVSKSKEQSFTTVATRYHTRWPENVRHLAIHNFTNNPQEISSLKCLRSVVIFGYEDPLTATFLSKFLYGDPKLLKVLDLYGAKLDSIPKQVFKLFHLRYLSLNGTGVKIIPKSIGRLQNLEVIDLTRTNVTELPVEILNLRKLRSLWLGGVGDYSNEHADWGCKCPLRIGKLICLETLYNIEADCDKIVPEIGNFMQLQQLSIT
ncbi:disease resistance protein RPM1-like [Coffea eugenioides]|uniref:disease resistance protein RPM1-like n=1 Tax=Coffea eugenioides TaxID=49369 RepID=UPI000F6107F2|nr:disease resistance protein RPM1-like [Coffea eugenioides]